MDKNYIGTCIHFDESAAKQTVERWKLLLPEIKKVGVVYESLDTTFSFTQEIYNDIVENRLLNITPKYIKKVENEIKGMKVTSSASSRNILDSIPQDLMVLASAVESLFQKCTEINNRSSGLTALPAIDLTVYRIIDGQPVLDETAIDKIDTAFKIIIQTETENSKYVAALEFQKAYKKLTASFLVGKSHLTNPVISNNYSCVFAPLPDNELLLNPSAIKNSSNSSLN